jgi:hypothetical protein
MKTGPNHDEVLEALERALRDNPHLRKLPPEEVARRLVSDGYVRGEPPSPAVVGEAMATVAAEERAFGPDVPLEES